MDQHYYKLIEDYSKKKISSKDLADLMDWVAYSLENQETFREVLKTYETAEQILIKPVHQQKSWQSIQQHIAETAIVKKPHLKIRRKYWFQLIAAILIATVIPIFYFGYHKKDNKIEVSYYEINNAKGQKRLVIMPDGSNVYLNGDSKIRYAKNFNSGKRIVYLTGEAFFDVQHRSKQPFIVHTGQISTTVLGTSFNINAYKSSKNISITVQTGKVGVVIHNNHNHTVRFLLPNQQLNISSNLSISKTNVDATEVNSWREYKMVFYDQSLSEIAKVIEREYDIDIEIKREMLRKVKLTTKFNKSSITEIMDMLTQLTNSKYKIYNKKVIIF